MSITDPTGHVVADPNSATPDEEEEEALAFTIKDTKALTKALRDGAEDLDVGEDVWSELEVNEPKNPESSIAFTIEGTSGRYYEVRVTPKEPVAEPDGD